MPALDDLRVLELCTLNAGPYCGKLLADLGADVVKIEPPEGDPSRRHGPFPNDVPSPEGSGTFVYLNTNKRSVTLDLNQASARGVFRRLAQDADILLEDLPPGTLDGWGLGHSRLSESNPRLITVSITPFGQTGPYRDFSSYPINTFHAGGEGYTLPGSLGWHLYSDRPPLTVPGNAGEHYAGLMAAVATMMAVAARELTGSGQHVDVSKQEALMNLSRAEVEKYPNWGFVERRATRMHPVGGLFQCKDGFVQIGLSNEGMWTGLVQLMGNPEWAAEPECQDRRKRSEHGEVINTRISQWALTVNKDDLYHRGQALGISITPVLRPDELFASPHLQDRGFFQPVPHPDLGEVLMPSVPYHCSETPWGVRIPAPRLSEHTSEALTSIGYSDEDVVRLRAAGAV